jgi:hypothetical protein
VAAKSRATNGRPWLVTAVEQQGQLLRTDLVHLPDEGTLGGFVVSVSDRLGSIVASVSDRLGNPRPDYTVIVFPEDAELWPMLGRRIFASRTTDKARVVIPDVIPGDYRLAVVEDPEINQWLLSDYLRQLVPSTVPLRVGAEGASIHLLVGGSGARP